MNIARKMSLTGSESLIASRMLRLTNKVTSAYTPSSNTKSQNHEAHFRDSVPDGIRKLPKSTYSVGINDFRLTFSPIPNTMTRSDAFIIRDFAQSLMQERLRETSWPAKTKFETAWFSGVKSFVIFEGTGVVTVGGGIAVFSANSIDDVPSQEVVNSAIADELTTSLAGVLQTEFPFITETGLAYITEAPSTQPSRSPTKTPTHMPTRWPSAEPSMQPSTPQPSLSPTETPTKPVTQGPSLSQTTQPSTTSAAPSSLGLDASAVGRQTNPGGSSIGVPAVVGTVTVAFAVVMLVTMAVLWKRHGRKKYWRERPSPNHPVEDDDSKVSSSKRPFADGCSDAGSSSRFGRIVAVLDAVVLARGGAAASDMDQSNTSSEDDTEDFPQDFENVEVVEPTIVPVRDEMHNYQVHQHGMNGYEMEGFEGWGGVVSESHHGDAVDEFLDQSDVIVSRP